MSRKIANILINDTSSETSTREVRAYLSKPYGRWAVHRSINAREIGWSLTMVGVGYRLPGLLGLTRLELLELADILDAAVDTSGVTGPTVEAGWTADLRKSVAGIVRPFVDAKIGGVDVGAALASPEKATTP